MPREISLRVLTLTPALISPLPSPLLNPPCVVTFPDTTATTTVMILLGWEDKSTLEWDLRQVLAATQVVEGFAHTVRGGNGGNRPPHTTSRSIVSWWRSCYQNRTKRLIDRFFDVVVAEEEYRGTQNIHRIHPPSTARVTMKVHVHLDHDYEKTRNTS